MKRFAKHAVVLGAAVAALVAASPADAAVVWDIEGHHAQNNFEAGGLGEYTFLVSNVGTTAASGPVQLDIALPPDVTTRFRPLIGNQTWFPGLYGFMPPGWDCGASVEDASSLHCTSMIDPVPPGPIGLGRLTVYVKTAPGTVGQRAAVATVSGGGGAPVSATETVSVGAPATTFGISPGTLKADAFDGIGAAERRAGTHPDHASLSFDLNVKQTTDINPFDGATLVSVFVPIGRLRNFDVRLPRGFVGNPTAASQCDRTSFAATNGPGTACPASSQVGLAEVVVQFLGGAGGPTTLIDAPVYNVAPPRGVLATFGLQIDGRQVLINASIDPRDHSVVTSIANLNESLPLHFQTFTLWGVPADPIHDSQRWNPQTGAWGVPFTTESRPFLTLPSECGVSDTTDVTKLVSWEEGVNILESPLGSAPIALSGCDALSFDPSISLALDNDQPDAPTGLQVDIGLPQSDTLKGRGTPPLRDATVKLPEGMTINPAAADGLAACADSQLALGTNDAVSCPDGAKIGTATALSPAIEGPIEGSVYIRSQHSDDPASGDMFRMAIVLEHQERGLLVKLPGSVKADPATGRLTAEFRDNPQLPVSKISLRLKGGPRATLATPPTCGTKTVQATMTSWGGQTAQLSDTMTIACPGVSALAPSFKVASTDPRGGVFSPLAVDINRPDGQQYMNGLSMELAPGMLAKLKGVPVCASAAAAAGSCDVASRVGTATVGAGAGNPFYLKGGVYLTEGYRGGPYGLVVKVRAAAGPFDLGDVIVRQALYVDPIDAHVTVVSDPLPTVVKGVPVRLRSLQIDVDRPGFTSTPTSCAKKAVASTLGATDGTTASLSSPYQVRECASLDLKPSLGLSLSGKGQTTDGKHPAITANLIQQPGQANLKKVTVKLPLSVALDPDNSQSDGLCSFVEGSKPDPKCPKSSVVGSATAITPILDQPLTGPVYFVKNERKDPKSGRSIKTLPKIVIPLTGQNGIKLTLTGTSDVIDERLVTTFNTIPDAPVSSFKLNINGGKKGILVISGDKADICKSTQIASQQIDGQNNKQADAAISIQTPSCPLKVISKKVAKSSVAIRIGGLSAGKVTVTGKAIKKTTKTITTSTVATITAKRTKGKPGKVTVSYDPAGPAKARKTTK